MALQQSTSYLRNPKHEKFAQLVVAGKSPKEAAAEVGFQTKGVHSKLMKRKDIQGRIADLTRAAAERATVSRTKILERIYDDWDQARRLGQMTAALKAGELMGKELHKMFVDRKEVGEAGDFDNKSPQEMLKAIQEELSSVGLSLSDIGIKMEEDAPEGEDNHALQQEQSLPNVVIPPGKSLN